MSADEGEAVHLEDATIPDSAEALEQNKILENPSENPSKNDVISVEIDKSFEEKKDLHVLDDGSNGYEKANAEGPQHPLERLFPFLFPLAFTFEYATPMVLKGFFKGIEMTDVWRLPTSEKAEVVSMKFEKDWESNKAFSKGLHLTIAKLIWARFTFAGFLKLLVDICGMSSPIILRYIISYLENTNSPVWFGYVMAVTLLLVQLIQVFCNGHYFVQVMQVGMRVRSALISLIYKKALILSNKSKQSKTTGEIVNLMAIDAQNIGDVFTMLHFLWTGVLQIIVCLVALFFLINWVTVAGLAAMILVVPIQGVLMALMSLWRKKILKYTDERVKLINEVLQGIKIIKFFSWENSYLKKIYFIRKMELLFLSLSAIIRSIFMALMMGTPVLVSVSTFLLYAHMNNYVLDPSTIFPALAYFNILRFPLTFLPLVLTMSINANVSVDRIQNFLKLEELEKRSPGQDFQNPIKVSNGSFEWDERPKGKKQVKKSRFPSLKKKRTASEEEIKVNANGEEELKEVFKLRDINLSVPKGSLCIIVGTVGSGKSSLLNSLIGEMKQISGETEISGSVAYCAQQAWIMNNTLRENIIFGNPFDQERYEKIIDVCELRKDLKVLTAGDMTEIGEKGINLSGGQKQRASIARAVYSDREIYLLDDILSAVDAHVGKSIFEKCIKGILSGKTRLFVTHQLQYLHQADYIAVMDQGKIAEKGTYQELMSIEGGLLRKLIDEHLASEGEEEEKKYPAKTQAENKIQEVHEKVATDESTKKTEDEKKLDGKLVQEEERSKGGISLRVIWDYTWKMGGPIAVILIALLFTIGQCGLVAPDWWLSMWMSFTFKNLNDIQYLYIYASIAGAGISIVFIRDSLWNFFALLASTRLHTAMLNRIMRAPMSFFDTTPTGRILSRFSKDQENADNMLVMVLSQFFSSLFQVLATFALISYSVPWFLIPLLPIGICYLIVLTIYRNTNRSLKQFENISRSPLYTHFAESLNGISTIRAYKLEQDFLMDNQKKVDYSLKAYFGTVIGQRWLSLRLDILGVIIVFVATLLSVSLRGTVEAAVAGLSLTYSLQVIQFMSWCVKQATDAEANMNAVERLLHYSKSAIPNEKPEIIYSNRPAATWPKNGDISFENVTMRYRPELPPVLCGISLSIHNGEKIGVVGRTGAGKSSLMLAIYRMVEVSEGSIIIDGMDISKIGLKDLRTKLSIIPQDPVLFSGTIRSNLDPFNEQKDEVIWRALEEANLKNSVQNLEGGLNAQVNEGGENFSVGERQLLCLARALIKKCKILILDEATASVDFETDAIIQKTVRKSFKDYTSITIAHRLNTIIDSDRILVMDKGQIAEFDTPKNLVLKEDSILNSMLKETGSANCRMLRNIALGEISLDIEKVLKGEELDDVSKIVSQEEEGAEIPISDQQTLKDNLQEGETNDSSKENNLVE